MASEGQLSMQHGKVGWGLGLSCVLGSIVGQVVFGEMFYGLYLSEALLSLGWLLVFVPHLARAALPRLGVMSLFFLLCAGYLAFSFTQDRELYWIARQAAFVLYASAAVIAYSYTRLNGTWYKPLQRHLLAIGAVMMIFHKIVDFNQGHAFFLAYLIFLIGLAYWLTELNGVSKKVFLSLAGLVMSVVTNSHSAFAVTPLAIGGAVIFIQYPRYRMPMMMLGAVVIAVLAFNVDGFSDVNAIWRFLYWQGVVEESWGRGWFLLGRGFGLPFMPQDSEAFPRLITQVSVFWNEHYQLMTVPPHNGILTILIYLGIFGVVSVLYPYFKAFRILLREPCSRELTFLFCGSFGLLLLLSSNQFVEVPYNAIFYWLCHGVLVARLRVFLKANA
jgi:hypothetical protein